MLECGVKNNLKMKGGTGGLYNPDDVRVAHGAFFDLGFESEKKWGFVQVHQQTETLARIHVTIK